VRGASIAGIPKTPTLKEEQSFWDDGHLLVAGLDEVGRGPLAGPVVAAAVVLDPNQDHSWSSGIRDSKQLSSKQRQLQNDLIRKHAHSVAIGTISSNVIDEVGIVNATRKAMARALSGLPAHPDALLIDALKLPDIETPQKSFIKGDSRCISIAAASIVAKVARDGLMGNYDETFPGYGFARHKGYSTKEHISSLWRLGPCPIHRRSFAPVREVLWGPAWLGKDNV
jgi:ribonuclease HII